VTLRDAIRDAAAAMVAGDWFHYPDAPIPHAVDAAATTVVRGFASARDAEERAAVLGLLSGEHIYVLQNFAVRMASLAVRRRSADILRTALQAVALAGSSPESDWRDLGLPILPLRDAARRIGADRKLFDEAGRLAVGRTERLIRDAAPKRTISALLEQLVGLFVKGPWTTVEDREGFRYVSTERGPDPETLMRTIAEARRLARGRFRLSTVLYIPGRGPAVPGEILEGRIKVGEMVRAAHLNPTIEWLVIGVEFVDSPSIRKSEVALMLADKRPIDELRRLLPQGSILVWGPQEP
jgi:hypothetical protein